MADDAPPPPWVRHPEIARHSIGWRMGYGESFLEVWWAFASATKPGALVDYFRAHAPLPIEWVDFVAMALAPDRDPVTAAELDEPADYNDVIRQRVERIADLGLFDLGAWRAYFEP